MVGYEQKEQTIVRSFYQETTYFSGMRACQTKSKRGKNQFNGSLMRLIDDNSEQIRGIQFCRISIKKNLTNLTF